MTKELLKSILTKNAYKAVEWAIAGASIVIGGNYLLSRIESKIDSKINSAIVTIDQKDSIRHVKSNEVIFKMVNKIGDHDSIIYQGQIKEIRRLQAEKFELWKQTLNLQNELKKNDWSYYQIGQ